MPTDSAPVQCRCRPVHETDWTDSERPPSMAIVEAIAAVEGVDPTELTPISDEVDLASLDRLLANSATDACGIFSFTIAGWNVFVSGDGPIKICDPSEMAALSPVFESGSAD